MPFKAYEDWKRWHDKKAAADPEWAEWRRSGRHKARRHQRQALIREIKLTAGCRVCGYDEHPAALDFHHLNPKSKEFGLGQAGGRSEASVFAEVMKCEILCANCHRVLTADANPRKLSRPDGVLPPGPA